MKCTQWMDQSANQVVDVLHQRHTAHQVSVIIDLTAANLDASCSQTGHQADRLDWYSRLDALVAAETAFTALHDGRLGWRHDW